MSAAGMACRLLASPALLLRSIFRVSNVAAGGTIMIQGLLDLSPERCFWQQKNTLHESVTAVV